MNTPAVRPGRVYPDLGALAGEGLLADVAGGLLTIVLVLACLMVVISAAAWGVSHATGNTRGTVRARTGVLVGLGAAVLAGGLNAWLRYLLDLGAQL